MGLIRCKNGHLFSEKKHGNICPYCNVAVKKNSNPEEDPQGKYSELVYLNDLEVLKPVTGWLVCLEGPSHGRDSQGLVYVMDDGDNWDAVFEPRMLEAGDRIKIGQSIFIFVPLCGENDGFVFNWKENG